MEASALGARPPGRRPDSGLAESRAEGQWVGTDETVLQFQGGPGPSLREGRPPSSHPTHTGGRALPSRPFASLSRRSRARAAPLTPRRTPAAPPPAAPPRARPRPPPPPATPPRRRRRGCRPRRVARRRRGLALPACFCRLRRGSGSGEGRLLSVLQSSRTNQAGVGVGVGWYVLIMMVWESSHLRAAQRPPLLQACCKAARALRAASAAAAQVSERAARRGSGGSTVRGTGAAAPVAQSLR